MKQNLIRPLWDQLNIQFGVNLRYNIVSKLKTQLMNQLDVHLRDHLRTIQVKKVR